MAKKTMWAVIGCANIVNERFAPALNRSQNSVPWAIASRSLNKAQEFAERFGFEKAYDSYQAILDDVDVDAVYIALPNSLHKEWILKAIQAKKHVLCEKPLCMNAEECSVIMRDAQKADVQVMEAFTYRYMNRIRRVKDVLRSGSIGKVRHIAANFGVSLMEKRNNYRFSRELGGGATLDLASYGVNFINSIFKSEPESVTSSFHMVEGVDTAASITLQYGSGETCSIDVWYDAYVRRFAEIIGTEGWLQIPNAFFSRGEEFDLSLCVNGIREKIKIVENDPFVDGIHTFEELIQTGAAENAITLQETLRNMRTLDRIMSDRP